MGRRRSFYAFTGNRAQYTPYHITYAVLGESFTGTSLDESLYSAVHYVTVSLCDEGYSGNVYCVTGTPCDKYCLSLKASISLPEPT